LKMAFTIQDLICTNATTAIIAAVAMREHRHIIAKLAQLYLIYTMHLPMAVSLYRLVVGRIIHDTKLFKAKSQVHGTTVHEINP
jgi:hypothetical protein